MVLPAKIIHHIKHNNRNNDDETIFGHLVQSTGKQLWVELLDYSKK